MSTQALTRKWEPNTLDAVVGQPEVVHALKAFCADPYTTAMVFHGPTGVGKGCTSKSLAYDLGIDPDNPEMSGLVDIPSGKQDGRAVEDLLRQLRMRPMFGSGWKVAVVNEADYMTAQAETIWLDGLEKLPPQTVVIFTTNNIRKLSKRLVGRCELFEFEGTSKGFVQSMQEHLINVFSEETGTDPDDVTLPKNIGRYELADETYSIRLALQQLTQIIRAGNVPKTMNVPFIRDEFDELKEKQRAAGRKAAETRKRNAALAAKGKVTA